MSNIPTSEELDQPNEQKPSHPDLYIPIMSFISYVLLIVLFLLLIILILIELMKLESFYYL